MKQPFVRWYTERSFVKEIYFWKRRYYCMVALGKLRRVRMPKEHRQTDKRPIILRLLS